jgi:hypothetical protein
LMISKKTNGGTLLLFIELKRKWENITSMANQTKATIKPR